ncbi:LysE family translocator [Mumia sp. DW29H23]|uniref:LysE family translocator n=1 Tax=Mumia sp. DW29H23 TaxID=3421241 RepID=UPI003D6941E6
MIDTTAAIGISLVALGMVLTPGPNMLYLVSRSISQGPAAGLVSLTGTAVGFAVYMVMANIGLAAVFVVVPWLYVALKVAGAAYLFWLAWRILRPGGLSAFEARDLPRDSHRRLFTMGLTTNLLNPKAAIMYVSLIPQFVDLSRDDVVVQGFVLGSIQITISAVVNATLIVVAGAIAAFLARRPTWMAWQRRVSGSLLGLVGVKLAVEAPKPA